MASIEIKDIAIVDIDPYGRNPRDNSGAIEAVRASIEEFGFKVPIVLDAAHTIIAGHTRYEAAKRLGMHTVPCIIADDLTPEQVKAFRLADNKTAELAEWDWDLLAEELEDISLDMEVFGFEPFDVETGEPEAVEDGYDAEPPEVPTSKAGEIYRLGDHILIVGDSTEPETIARAMDALEDGADADLLLTDPPYNVDYTGKTDEALKIDNDSFGDSEAFTEFLADAMGAAVERVKPGGAFYVWYASWFSRELFEAAQRAGLQVRQVIVWNKSVFALGRQDYQWKHELCLYGWRDGAAHYFVDDRTLTTVWDYPEGWEPDKAKKSELVEFARRTLRALQPDVWDCEKPSASRLHPTMKPIPLMARAIINSTRRGEIVLDPFGGSGSTLIACEQLGRRCVTVELDPHYADVIIDRWETYTGREAVRVDAG